MKFFLKTSGLILFFLYCVSTQAKTAITINGKLDESQWRQAQTFTEFHQTWPNTGQQPKYQTEVLLFSNEQGIFVGFKNEQPPKTRSRKYSGHDQYTTSDFDMLFIDFNGDGNIAYEFVATLGGGTMDGTYMRGNQSSRDWDGPWEVATSEDDQYWYSEFFIPWSIASFRESTTHKNGIRQISVNFQRYTIQDGESYSFPDTSRSRANFTYEFHPIQIDYQEKSYFRPSVYASAQYDKNNKDLSSQVGADIIWKPSSSQQIIATLNPDFGQIETDALIVNYSAIETLRTDKRPFFAENQSLFDVRGPENTKILNTRRIGGIRESGDGSITDIDAAVKYLGQFDGLDLGVLVATERDSHDNQGDQFISARWLTSHKRHSFGQLLNWNTSNHDGSESWVSNFDYIYSDAKSLKVNSNLMLSDNSEERNSGVGFTTQVNYTPIRNWRNSFDLVYFDDKLDINDMGYLARNNLSLIRYKTIYDDYQFSKQSSLRRQRYLAEFEYQSNQQGEQLPWKSDLLFESQYKNKYHWRLSWQYQSSGIDDLISRGNGSVYLPNRHALKASLFTPNHTDFSWNLHYWHFQEGLSAWADKWTLSKRYYFNDHIRVDTSFSHIDSDDWLIPGSEGSIANYQRELNQFSLKAVAKVGDNADLSTTLQWYTLQAEGLCSYQIDSFKRLDKQGDSPSDFSTSQVSLQFKYRWRFGSLSDLYIVYMRNGLSSESNNLTGSRNILENAYHTPNQNHFTIKVNYHF